MIRENNKEKRLDWCRKMLRDKESFYDVIWTDESSVMLDPYSRRWRTPKAQTQVKHPAKARVGWYITQGGATPVVLFTAL